MSAWTCAFCLHQNPAGARFCNQCASALSHKPCRACDAVNEKTASACHRCHTPFAAEPPQAEVSTEILVAQADATLEFLRRELTQAARPSRDATPVREAAPAAPAPARASDAPSPALAAAVDAIPGPEAEVPLPKGDHFITLNDAPPAAPQEDVASQPVANDPPAAVVLRARRGSPAAAVAVILLLLALPLGLYAWRNPDQLQSWLAQLAAMMPDASRDAPALDTPGADSPPVATPSPAPPVEPSATTALPAETPAAATSEPLDVEAAASTPPADSPDTVAPSAATQSPVDPAAAAAAAAASAAKSASAARPRARRVHEQIAGHASANARNASVRRRPASACEQTRGAPDRERPGAPSQ